MIILAIECSAKSASAAVLKDGEVLCEIYNSSGLTHSQTLMPSVQSALEKTSLTPGDIDLVAVSEGPGSFTGIRIGLAAAKGMAFGGKRVAPISTLEVIAQAFADKYPTGEYILCAVMDARCGQFYNANFTVKEGKINRLCDDRALLGEEIAAELKDRKNVYAAGDGAPLFCEKFGIDDSGCSQRASALARIAVKKNDCAKDPKTVFGKYLRRPQAERERMAKMQGEKKA